MPNIPNCSVCEKELSEIDARHDYVIEYDREQGRWIKRTVDIAYSCVRCGISIDINEIADILRDLDEL